MTLIGATSLTSRSSDMTREEFLAQLPRRYPDDVMPEKIGMPGFELPELTGLVPYQPGDTSGRDLAVSSASDSNVVLLPPGFSPTARLRIIFSARALGNTVILGKGADPFGEIKVHGTNSIAILAGEDRGPVAINLIMQGVGTSFFWGRRGSSNGLSVFVEGDGQSTVIGEDCMVAQHASIMTSDMHAVIDLTSGDWLNPAAPVFIAPHVWLGWESMIMKGVTLGFGASIAARALVTRDVPDYAIAGGVPGRILTSNAIWTRPNTPQNSALAEIYALALRTGHAPPGRSTLIGSQKPFLFRSGAKSADASPMLAKTGERRLIPKAAQTVRNIHQ